MKHLFLSILILALFLSGQARAAVLVLSPNGINVTKPSLAAAVASADTAGKTIVITTPQTIGSNLIVPSTIAVRVENGGSFSVSSGATITFSGSFTAGMFHCFSGAGSIAFGDGSVKEVYPEWWGGSLQPALYTGKKVLVSSPVMIAAPVAVQNGQELEIVSSITAAPGFTGGDMIVLDGGAGGVSAMQKVLIHGGGMVDGAGLAQRGISIKLARQSRVEGIAIERCTMNGVYVGDSAAIASSYEITVENTTVRNNGVGSNDPSSVGILYDNATDSVARNNVVVGYRTGLRNNAGNINFISNHPWTLTTYGPMTYCFYVNGTAARLEDNYADSPYPASGETVYGYYLAGYNTHMYNNSGFLASGTSVDNTAVGIYVAKPDGLYGSISGGHFYSQDPALKWVSILGGNYGYHTDVVPAPTTDGSFYTSSGGARMSIPDFHGDDTGVMNMTPSDGASDKTTALVVNSRARFGYNGVSEMAEISDNGATKAISFSSGGVERLRISSSGFRVFGLPIYPDNLSAITGGLATGEMYRTSSGVVMVVY